MKVFLKESTIFITTTGLAVAVVYFLARLVIYS
jgi:hypothetical protein